MVNLAVSEFAVLGCAPTEFFMRVLHVYWTRTKILRVSAPLEPSGWNCCSATTQSLQNHNVVSYSLDTM